MRSHTAEVVVRATLVTLGVVTATPMLAVGWPGTLDFAYGIGDPSDPMVLALLKHRGVLQGALGASLVWSAYHAAVRVPVAVTAIATKSSFLGLMFSLPGSSWRDAAPGALFDVGAVTLLAVIAVTCARARRPVTAGP
ncbi:hypothetical protein [Actinomadura sp. HBU206391]|uniref:hypothetical protein n=1 Tax=Actinomadura sp. HBU206391 TaxID=2731692 RepID=UPI001650C551|nr:hypothetical protein [Actinomadura sp. HBU206391]MBC6459256.1 hypothetical protein [Actinomadura sp. HBU206391]